MKNRIWVSFVLLSVGLSSWGSAQSPRTDLFDFKKSQQELEIMRGILGTTLGFVVRELQSKDSSARTGSEDDLYRGSWRFSNITAFYLYGQGAVFVIPASNFRTLLGSDFGASRSQFAAKEALTGQTLWEAELAGANDQMTLLQEQMAEMTLAGVPGGIEGGVTGGVVGGVPGGVAGGVPGGVRGPFSERRRSVTGGAQPTPPPKPPQRGATTPQAGAPQPPAQEAAPSPRPARQAPATTRSEDEMRKKLSEAQDRVKKRREEAAARRARFLEQVGLIKVYLIETLANHGDSLTHVRPNEYITIIITTDEGDHIFNLNDGTRSQREVLTVQKSTVIDYKAGKLSLDAFKQKVLNYNN